MHWIIFLHPMANINLLHAHIVNIWIRYEFVVIQKTGFFVQIVEMHSFDKKYIWFISLRVDIFIFSFSWNQKEQMKHYQVHIKILFKQTVRYTEIEWSKTSRMMLSLISTSLVVFDKFYYFCLFFTIAMKGTSLIFDIVISFLHL